ncbi:MAG: type II secretion system F family protein [Lentisphaeria bacterium]|nr:type II secretion system F family protein [Lentisphaeria bacterium]
MMQIFQNLTFVAGLCAAAAVTFASLVVINFMTETSTRYKERYIRETGIEYEDILLSMPAGRVFDLSLGVSALGMFLGILLISIVAESPDMPMIVLVGMIGAVVCFPIPRAILKHMKKKRLQKFNEQLEDALLSISGSLKAGFSILQALDLIASENRPPISYEFTVLMQELRLGVAFDEALEKMSKRVGSQDFELVSVAISTARQTGGELTGVLERLASVIRERVRIQQKLIAMTAQGRLQAYMIGAMPFLLLFAMSKVAPDMMRPFFNSIVGILVICGAILLVIAGFFTIRKITTIDV